LIQTSGSPKTGYLLPGKRSQTRMTDNLDSKDDLNSRLATGVASGIHQLRWDTKGEKGGVESLPK